MKLQHYNPRFCGASIKTHSIFDNIYVEENLIAIVFLEDNYQLCDAQFAIKIL